MASKSRLGERIGKRIGKRFEEMFDEESFDSFDYDPEVPEAFEEPEAFDYDPEVPEAFEEPEVDEENEFQYCLEEARATGCESFSCLGKTFYRIFDYEEYSNILAKAEGEREKFFHRERRERILKEFSDKDYLPQVCFDSESLKAARTKFPNLVNVIDHLEDEVAFSAIGNHPLTLSQPLLLLGPSGCGKTQLLQDVFRGRFCYMFDCASANAGWGLTGSEPLWHKAHPGIVAKTFLNSGVCNYCLILDELDKARGDDRYSIQNAMTQLLEVESAKHFRDLYLEFEMDASRLNIVATANYEDPIERHILDRFMVVECREPDLNEREVIIRSIYLELLKARQLTTVFSKKLPPAVLDRLVQSRVSIRKVKGILQKLMARTLRCKKEAKGQKLMLSAELLDDLMPEEQTRKRIGFI
ncbi:AAA family ATPase [Candidatus Parcubacteria bacterium]|nr:MAG: AAA family ATPase [Candidatus Parcubacteria bacterium]